MDIQFRANGENKNETHLGEGVSESEEGGELDVIQNNEHEDELEKNSWTAPELDTMELCAQLIRTLNGRGDQIDQYNLYLDPQSALEWEAVSNNESYMTAHRDLPLDHAVESIQREIERRSYLDQTSLDIISLGPGNAHTEVSLIKKLLRQTNISKIRLYLLDISQPLLKSAGNYTRRMLKAEKMKGDKGVAITECNADFYHLSQYDLVNISVRAKRMTLVTMFGYTFGNLKNERTWLKTSLNHFHKDTLLLMDVVMAFGNADDENEIKAKDPLLNGESKYQKVLERWISVPFRRYREGLKDTDSITFMAQLDETRKSIEGSYCIEIVTRLPDKAEFSTLYFKRYTTTPLLKRMGLDGWESIDGSVFGSNSLLHLFRKIS